MLTIQSISNDPKQLQTLLLDNGNTFTLALEFKPQQIGWFMSIVYQDFEIDNVRIVTSPNILRQFKNLIPFGIGCFTKDGFEPLLLEDFSSGRSELRIMTSADVAAFEDILSNG